MAANQRKRPLVQERGHARSPTQKEASSQSEEKAAAATRRRARWRRPPQAREEAQDLESTRRPASAPSLIGKNSPSADAGSGSAKNLNPEAVTTWRRSGSEPDGDRSRPCAACRRRRPAAFGHVARRPIRRFREHWQGRQARAAALGGPRPEPVDVGSRAIFRSTTEVFMGPLGLELPCKSGVFSRPRVHRRVHWGAGPPSKTRLDGRKITVGAAARGACHSSLDRVG